MLELLLIFVCAIVAFFVINFIGKVMIPKSYQNELFTDEDDSTSFFNVTFRVISPTVVLCFEGLICKAFFPDFSFLILLYACAVYWLIRLAFWIVKRNRLKTRIWMIFSQAICSLGISWYLFDAIGDDPSAVLLPRIDDVSFEFLILTSIVVLYFLSESPLLRKDADHTKMAKEIEKKLFSIDKLCREKLPVRYREDVVLRIFFYAIALIEDTYRPKSFRRIENALLCVKLKRFVKTAGIMQVPTEKPLTDEQSVEIAFDKVSKIYDEHLIQSMSFAINTSENASYWSPELSFYEHGYSYNFYAMLNSIESDFGILYGKYCGSFEMEVASFFVEAKGFVQSQYDELADRKVEVPYRLSFLWDSLPICGWRRLDRESGFACFGGGDAVRAIKCNHIESSTIVEAVVQAGLSGQVLFCYNGLEGGVVLFLEDTDPDKLDTLAGELSSSVEIVSYHFDQFVEDPKGFIQGMFVEESHG